MKVFSAHLRAATVPVLVPEKFSWGAAIFGPFWLWAHRAWIAGILALLAWVAAGAVPIHAWRPWLVLAVCVLLGLVGQDLRRWSLARRGFLLAHVVAARDQDEALARLLANRPDLAEVALR
jgi:hypothetical protein